jgi:O-antigen/teichoic acid export membrane protein
VGVVVAREFGRTAETDGFFAAYGVFMVLSIAAASLRVIVQPPLARARAAERLGEEVAAYAAALTAFAVPAIAISTLAAGPIGDALTGSLPQDAADAAAATLRWLVPAAVFQVYAALAASALAALDDYGTAALAYALGSACGLTFILLRVHENGLVAVAWGSALTAAVGLAIMVARLASRGRLRRPSAGLGRRLAELAEGSALPLALQVLFLVCVRLTADLGVGEVTSFSYAFLIASGIVSVTASSLGLVSSVPLTRAGLRDDVAVRHLVSTSWLALAAVGAAAGVFALAGERIVEWVLGEAYGGEVGGDLGRLVAGLAPWMAVSAGVTLTFPLLFVRGRPRGLVPLSLAAVAIQVPLAWALRELFGLAGIVASLAIASALVFGALLMLISRETFRRVVPGVAAAGAVLGVLAVIAFLPPALLGPIGGAVVGLAIYIALLVLLRPAGLRDGWGYVRALR